jgi:signal transduction histidine kinase
MTGTQAGTGGRWQRGLRRAGPRALGHSIKARLVLMFLLLALGTTLVFVAGTRELFSSGWRELARPLVGDYIDRLAAEIGDPPDLARAQALVQRLPVAIRIDGPRLHWASHPQRDERGPRDPRWRAVLERRTADGHRIVFGIGDWRWDERPHWLGSATLAALLALTALAYAYVRRLLRPLEAIRAGVQRYGQGDFARPIALRRRDELGELAAQVDGMATSLQRMLEGQRGLLLAISHELRSPLTRARLHAELLADGEQRAALLRDLGLMRDLIGDLLEGERLAGGAAALQREALDLNALARDRVAAQFAGRDITLRLDDTLPPLWLDRVRLELLLRNLLDNALRHGAGTPVELRTGAAEGEGGGWLLSVRDHGPGVAPQALQQLGTPFFRPDAARTRAAGGVGLGLHLCRLVASSHGGTLRWQNASPGLQVSLWLPPAAARPPA